MKLITTLLLILLTNQLFSQEFSREYGKVKLNELTFKKYFRDTNAAAVMIYDIGKSRFIADDNITLLFERSVKIRVMKSAGVRWGEVEIPYYYEGNVLETVLDIEAASYNIENGEIVKTPLTLKNIYDEKYNEFWRLKKFAIPNVKEGSVIEYRYTIQSPYLFNLRDWEFQRSIPTAYSEYTTYMIPFYEYIYIMQGRNKFDVFEQYQSSGIEQQYGPVKYYDMVYKFGMKDVPAFTDESFITSKNDYIWKLDFQLAKVYGIHGEKRDIISTWPALCNDMIKEPTFGKYCNAVEKSTKEILNLSELTALDKNAQLEYIVNHVKKTYSWNGNSSKYANKTLREFQKEKTGNSANINLYLAGLLKGAGFEAYPVMISTRDHGAVYTDYPFLHFFNYVIVLAKIDDKYVFVDATDLYCPYNRIPSRCLNNVGLVVKKDSEEWAKLVNPEVSKIEKYLTISFGEDSLKFTAQNSYSIYEAYDFKVDYKNDLAEIAKTLERKGYNNLDSLTTNNYENSNERYTLTYKATTHYERIGDKIYLSPFLNEPLSENPLKQSVRTYPVDFIYPFGRTFVSDIMVPKGYKVEYLPEPLLINNAMVMVEYNTVSAKNNRIIITGKYSFKNSVYEPQNYSDLKFVYNEIIKKFNEKIVLVRQ